MEQEIKFEFLVLPVEILSLKLNPIETMVLALVKAFSKPPKYCHASNEYIAKIINASESSVSNAISNLIKLGFIDKVSFDGRRRVIKCSLQTSFYK